MPLQTAEGVNPAVAAAIETALRQPMDDASYAQIMQNDALFEQVLLDEQVVTNDDGTQGIIRTYEFVPRFQTRGASVTSYPMVEYNPTGSTARYVRLYTTFTHNGVSASCIERSGQTNGVTGYRQLLLVTNGNGSASASATLKFERAGNLRVEQRVLEVSCDKNGSITTKNKEV